MITQALIKNYKIWRAVNKLFTMISKVINPKIISIQNNFLIYENAYDIKMEAGIKMKI